jgi:hypothetical protein
MDRCTSTGPSASDRRKCWGRSRRDETVGQDPKDGALAVPCARELRCGFERLRLVNGHKT